MPKMCEKGYAQNVWEGLCPKNCLSKNGGSQEVKGYAQLKGRAMPNIFERGYAQKTKLNILKTKYI